MTLISGASHIIFDVDGTLYDKKHEYQPGQGSIEDAHEFFRYTTFSLARQDPSQNAGDLTKIVVSAYQDHTSTGRILDAIASFPDELKKEYKYKVKEHGSNGKVFAKEFGYDSGFFATIVGQVDFDSILSVDPELQNLISTLQKRGYKLGILTTETYQTAEKVCDILGVPIDNFAIQNGTEYPILCSQNVQEKKPSPEGFEKTIRATQVQNPSQLVYVGDSFTKDIEASMRSGLKAVHVKNNGTGNINVIDCDVDGSVCPYISIDRLYQLKDVVE